MFVLATGRLCQIAATEALRWEAPCSMHAKKVERHGIQLCLAIIGDQPLAQHSVHAPRADPDPHPIQPVTNRTNGSPPHDPSSWAFLA